MAWSTLTARSAGDAILASDQNITADNFAELAPFFSAWTTFTPTLSSSTGGLNLGTTATQTGAYLKVGRLVIWRAEWIAGGSGIAAGNPSGEYQFTLPGSITAAGPTNTVIGSGVVWGGSGNYGNATARASTSSVIRFFGDATPNQFIGQGSYGAASGWFIRIFGAFEATS